MRQALYRYCTQWEPLGIFDSQHLATLAMSVALVVMVPWFARMKLNDRSQQVLGSGIGWTAFAGYALWAAIHAVAGSFDVARHLPMHLCYVVAVITPLVMTWRSFTAFEFVYYCAFSGVLQACISPDECARCPHFDYFRFWMLHTGVILSAVYAVVVYRMQPTARGVLRTWLWVLAFLGLAIVVNCAFGTNYFYIRDKPPNSLLDYMGPWPWYIITAMPVAFVLIGIGYVPIWLVERLKR